jgi:hypothetical protein
LAPPILSASSPISSLTDTDNFLLEFFLFSFFLVFLAYSHSWPIASIEMSSDDQSAPLSRANEAFQRTSDVILTDFFPGNNFSRCREYYSDLGVSCYPFSGSDQEKVLNGPPLTVCLHCGGFVNDLCRFSRIEGSSSSKWMCSLCNNMNYGRMVDMENTAELKSGYYHCIEREPISFSSVNNLIVLAIDLNILKTEEDILAVFRETFEKLSSKRKDLSETAQIFLLFFDSFSFRFVRLGEKSFEPLMVDVIPFSHYENEGEAAAEEQHRSCNWRELFQKGVFHLSLFLFLRHFSSIESGLRSFLRTFLRVYRNQRRSAGVPSSSSSSVVISFQLLFSLLSDLSGIFSPAPRMTLFLLSNRSLPVLSSSSSFSSSLSLAKDYSQLLFCSVFYFFLGNDSISTGELLPFLSVTGGGGGSERGGGGGQLFLCESITHNHFQLNFLGFLLGCSIKSDSHSISSSTSSLSGGREDREVAKTRKEFRETVLEIRCNHNVAVKSVAGSLLSYSAITRAREEEESRGRRRRGGGTTAWNKNSSSSSLLNPMRGFSYNESTSNNNNNNNNNEEQQQDNEEEEKEEDSLLSLFHDEKDHNKAFQEYQNYLQQEKQQQQGGTIGIGTGSEKLGMTRTFFREKRREYYREHAENQFFQVLLPSSPILSQEQEQEQEKNNENDNDDRDFQEMMISVLFDLIENHRGEGDGQGKGEREGDGMKKTSRDSSNNNNNSNSGSGSGGYFSGLKELVPFLFSSSELKTTNNTIQQNSNVSNKNNNNDSNSSTPSGNSTNMTAINDNNTTGMMTKGEKQQFNGNSSSSSESILSFGVVQLVVKSHYLLVQSTRSERVKETRVFSFRVNEIASNGNNGNYNSNSDYPSNKSGLERFRSTFQPSLWATLQIRGLVASYHQNLIESGYYHLHNNNSNNINEQNQRQQRLDEQG